MSAGAAGALRPVALTVNGRAVAPAVGAQATLLHLLRNDLGLNGPKYGCGLGQCGACTVLVDGVAARACVIPARGAAGRRVTTLEGLGGRGRLHPVQQAFVDAQAAQCGYCLNGMVMMAAALLAREPDPDEDAIRRELSGNLCRCGTHVEIVRAVRRAAALLRGPSGGAGAGLSAGIQADAGTAGGEPGAGVAAGANAEVRASAAAGSRPGDGRSESAAAPEPDPDLASPRASPSVFDAPAPDRSPAPASRAAAAARPAHDQDAAP
jgi:nicotinate dehydrogenase subunit A